MIVRTRTVATLWLQTRKGFNIMTEKEKRTQVRLDEKGKISILADKEGKLYGKDNNPARGDEGQKKFLMIKDGVTVEKALAAGLTRSDLRRARRKGWIGVENPPAPTPDAAKAAKAAKGAEAGAKA
jgi:hypothetical protein